MIHLKNISELVTLDKAYKKDGRKLLPQDLGVIKNASLVFNKEKILWLGPTEKTPEQFLSAKTFDLNSKTVTPEIVDSHTHSVFAGNRADEYAMRLNGESYEKIAQAGGGILSTVHSTQKADFETLFSLAKKRIETIYSYGVGTIEIKSGYGLSFESELKITKVIAKLKKHFGPKIQILNTFLAAHAVPKNYKNSNAYLKEVVLPLLNEIKEDVDFVDIFHEKGYFTEEDTVELFTACEKINVKTKIHADEFNDNGGAKLACQFNCSSADHLLKTGPEGVKALSESNTVATLLPGTALFLGKPLADARSFLDQGCKVALASDYNPGSCHFNNLIKIAGQTACLTKMNLAELWSSITLNASHALDLKNQGAIVAGLRPRISVFNCSSVNEITYDWSSNLSEQHQFFD